MKLRKKILSVIVLLLLGALVYVNVYIHENPSAQLLVSVISFSSSTLDNNDYLFYGIDLMDLFQNYMNSDVEYEGSAYFTRVKGFDFTSSGSIKGERSFSQRKMSCESDMNVLWADLGGVNLYAEDETVYMIVPMLDDMAFAFDTGVDLFRKGPSFTSDVDEQWFKDNAQNILDFLQSIDIDKTGDVYLDEDGEESYEYKMTIPQGQGQFIWDLLGTDGPDYDIVASIYLNKYYQTRRIVFDVSRVMEGTTIELCGDNTSTLIITDELPDNEKATMTIKRNGDVGYTNAFNAELIYEANNGNTYDMTSTITMDYIEDGMDVKISDIALTSGNETLASGHCSGSVKKVTINKDVFADVTTDLSALEPIDWKTIRDDTQGFVNDMISKSKKVLFLIGNN